MVSKRIHVFYSGRVQGVGFRFTAEAAARKFKLSGWASNLRDGRVEVVAEGDEAALKDFIERISVEMSNFISGSDVSWEHPSGEFKDFCIKFSE